MWDVYSEAKSSLVFPFWDHSGFGLRHCDALPRTELGRSRVGIEDSLEGLKRFGFPMVRYCEIATCHMRS